MSQKTETHQVPTDLEYFVVCGLGSLGQHCVSSLTKFGVKIVAVVLSTIDGLRRIEQGRLNLAAKKWHIEVMRALTSDAIFEGTNAIVRVTGCNLALARKTMNNLPQTLLIPLYQHQAQRLIRELKKVLIVSRLLSSE